MKPPEGAVPPAPSEHLGKTRPVVVATHPRSGTHLVIDLLRRHFPSCRIRHWPGRRLSRLYLSIDGIMRLDDAALPEDAAVRILRCAPNPVVKTHLQGDWRRVHEAQHYADRLDSAWSDWLSGSGRMLNVVRDGRDVLRSYHVFASGWDPSTPATLGEFIRQEVDGVSRAGVWANHVRSWLERPEVEQVKFEEVVSDPSGTLDRLTEFLGLPVVRRDPLLPAPIITTRGARLARWLPWDPQSTATVARDPSRARPWREVLDAGDRAFFHREAGDVLVRLGYEADDSWVDA